MSDLTVLQQHIGTAPTDHWDMPTQAALVKYQQAHGLPATGLPDPGTFVVAGVYKVPEVHHGSGMWRDLVTAGNQVPQWGWLLGAGFLGTMAYLAYRKENPRTKAALRRNQPRGHRYRYIPGYRPGEGHLVLEKAPPGWKPPRGTTGVRKRRQRTKAAR